MKRIVSILIMVIAITAAATAQNGRTKFATDMYQAKHEMIIEELGLTPTQQKQFMPLYEQMEREIYQVNRNARALASEVEKKKNPSDRDYEVAASALSNTRMHEGDKWEVYIPAKWGYGALKMDDIPAHSTLIFTLQLVKIER